MRLPRPSEKDYSPHSSLGYLTPVEFAKRYYEDKIKADVQPMDMAGSLSL